MPIWGILNLRPCHFESSEDNDQIWITSTSCHKNQILKSWWEWQPSFPHSCPLKHKAFYSIKRNFLYYFPHYCICLILRNTFWMTLIVRFTYFLWFSLATLCLVYSKIQLKVKNFRIFLRHFLARCLVAIRCYWAYFTRQKFVCMPKVST